MLLSRWDEGSKDTRLVVRMWQAYIAWGLAAALYSTSAHFEILLTNNTMRDHPLGGFY